MKRILLLFSLSLSLSLCGQHFRGGFQAGVLNARMVGLNAQGEWGTGFLYGMNVNYGIFKLEMNYIQKGGTFTIYDPYIGWFDVYKRSAQYIQFPVSIRFGARNNDDENSVYDFELGLAPASLLSVVSEKNYVAYRNNIQYRPFTLDFFTGAGLNFGDVMFLGLRFSWSVLPDIKRNPIPKGFFWQSFPNGHTITHQLVLRFAFGKEE